MPSEPPTGHQSSSPPAPAGKPAASVGSIFVFIVLLGIAYSMFSSGYTPNPVRIETEARVLEVRHYPPSAESSRPRLWLKFSFQTITGRQIVSTGSVRAKSYDAVRTGARITVSYRKTRPEYPRIASINPPPSKRTEAPAPAVNWRSYYLWGIPGLIPLLAIAVFLGLRRSARSKPTNRTSSHGHKRPDVRLDTAERPGRDRTRTETAKTVRPRKKSKVVERGSWFG